MGPGWLIGLTAALFLTLGLMASRLPFVVADSDSVPGEQVWRLQLMGDAPGAVRVARENLARAQSQDGLESEQVMLALDLLATALTAGPRELWAEAGTTARKALALRESLYGSEDVRMVGGIAHLVFLLYKTQEWEEAGRYLRRATRIMEGAPRRNGPVYESALMTLGEVFRQGSNFGASSRYYRRAVVGMEREYGRRDHRLAMALKNLGRVQEELGDHAAALRNAERAMAIYEEILPPVSDAIASSRNQIGNLHRRLGHTGQALSHYQRAEEIWRQLLGEHHPTIARSLNNQALLRTDAGDFDAAMTLFRRGRQLRENAYGPHHTDVAGSLIHIGNLLWKRGDHAGATDSIQAGIDILTALTGERHPDLADALTALAGVRKAAGDDAGAVAASIRAEAASRDFFRYSSEGLSEWEIVRYAELRPSALQTALSVLSESARRDEVAQVAGEPVEAIWDAVIGSRALAFATTRARRAAGGEAALPEHSGMAPEERGPLAEIFDLLTPGDALLAYVKSIPRGPSAAAAERSFMAFVARQGRRGPVAIPLGSAEEIERRIARWQEAVSIDPRIHEGESGMKEYIRAGDALREAIWDPVAGAIGDARRLFIVPDGELGLVSFATLPAGDGRYLVDEGPLLHYLTAEWILGEEPYRPGRARGTLLVTAPDYELSMEEFPGRDTKAGASPECDLIAPRFSQLPGAVEEGAIIQELLAPVVDIKRLAGAAASENAFRREAPRWRALHIATHGLTLQDPCPPARGTAPALVAALAFAGASGQRIPPIGENPEDGLLTTDEIASLDLEGVEWAVLSGCRTGVGQIHPDEGILHLGRAFHLAGVRTVIDSLWEVEDGATRAWMGRLYAERISGRTTIEAVQRASLSILDALRARHQATHPFFWGGFVATGDWR